jgi:hypothetical protein
VTLGGSEEVLGSWLVTLGGLEEDLDS